MIWKVKKEMPMGRRMATVLSESGAGNRPFTVSQMSPVYLNTSSKARFSATDSTSHALRWGPSPATRKPMSQLTRMEPIIKNTYRGSPQA